MNATPSATIVFKEAIFSAEMPEGSPMCDEPLDREGLTQRHLSLFNDLDLTTYGLLQCASSADLSRVWDLGPGRLAVVKQYLQERDMRLRGSEELLCSRIETIYGHVRRGPVEILTPQLYDLSTNSFNLRPKRSVGWLRGLGICTLGDFRGRSCDQLRHAFPPEDYEQQGLIHWLDGMLQMAGIRLER
jgi:hypothetical protein